MSGLVWACLGLFESVGEMLSLPETYEKWEAELCVREFFIGAWERAEPDGGPPAVWVQLTP